MGTSVIIYKEVFIKSFLMERVAGQSHHLRDGGFRQTELCPWAGGKERVSASTQGCKRRAEAAGLYTGCVFH